MFSMTGYGYAKRYSKKYGNFEVEIISLNSRVIEISLSGNRDVIGLEREIRNMIRKYFKRGKFKIKFYFPPPEDYEVDERKIKKILKSIKKFSKGKINVYFDNVDVLKEIFLKRENLKEKKRIFLKCLENAIKKLLKFREIEGNNLKKAIIKEANKLKILINNLNDEKCKEEKIRLLSHLESIFKTINSKKDGCGKKIDFLGQEILREGNTISQKSESIENINIAIEIKISAENIREIARNLE